MSTKNKTISMIAEEGVVTTKNYLLFKKAYHKAIKNKVEIFTFNGKEVVIGYAKYLIKWIDYLNKKKQKK